MPAKLFTYVSMLALTAGISVLATFSSSCVGKGDEGFPGGGGGVEDEDPEDTTPTTVVDGCPDGELFALVLAEEGDGTCTFGARIALDDECVVESLVLHGDGAVPGDESISTRLGTTIAPLRTPEERTEPDTTWSSPQSWSGPAADVNGALRVTITLGDVADCAALGTVYVQILASAR